MDINATIFGEMLTFAVLIWVTLKYIWPLLIKTMRERQEKIAEGLEAAERGKNKLKTAEQRSVEMLRDVRLQASKIFEKANFKAGQIIDEARARGYKEGQRMIEQSKLEIAQRSRSVEEHLRDELAALVLRATERVLNQAVDEHTHEKMIQQLIAEI